MEKIYETSICILFCIHHGLRKRSNIRSTCIGLLLVPQGRESNKFIYGEQFGKEIATLVNKELPAGSYSTEWNAGTLASGVYFYRLQATNHSEAKNSFCLKRTRRIARFHSQIYTWSCRDPNKILFKRCSLEFWIVFSDTKSCRQSFGSLFFINL